MNTRQAWIILLAAGLCACAPSVPITATPTMIPPTPSATVEASAIFTPTLILPTPTSTPLTCLTAPGRVQKDSIKTVKPEQEFLVYLPPCYDEMPSVRYPVLYLLHGQTYTDDQWVRMGTPTVADNLIHSNEVAPFIIVFPDDRYWNLSPGLSFGDRLINLIIPYVDNTYRTLNDRNRRALGGLSRGGGWAIQLGFTHFELFGAVGLHSPVIFKTDNPYIYKWIRAVPVNQRPLLWIDIGNNDRELQSTQSLETILADSNYLYEYHVYNGNHTEAYWSLHIEEYLRWYTGNWIVE